MFYEDAGSQEAVATAWEIMNAIIENLTIDSGLRESCESDTQMRCNSDQQSFKGILVEYMYISSFYFVLFSLISSTS